MYKFYINDVRVFPNFKSDLAKEIARETGQMFFREKLSSKLVFQGADFDRLAYADLETAFNLRIEYRNNKEYFKGVFYQTDCSIDYNNRILEASISPLDAYTEVLENLDKEIDLVAAAPKLMDLTAFKRPVIQVYLPGSDNLDNFLGGNHWVQEVTTPITSESDLVNKYYFSLNANLREFTIEMTGDASFSQFAGLYKGSLSDNTYYKVGNSNYRMSYVYSVTSLTGRFLILQLKDANGRWVNKYRCASGGADPYAKDGSKFFPEQTGQPGDNDIKGNAFLRDSKKSQVYVRYMLDTKEFGDLKTYPIPQNDIAPNNLNYSRVIGLNLTDTVIVYTETSTKPTKWGRTSTGEYYEQPPAFLYGKTYPLSRENWDHASYWFAFSILDEQLDKMGRKEFKVPGSFFLSEAIKVLLRELEISLEYKATSAFSQFFYAPNQVNLTNIRLVLTQKSNVLHGEGAKAALKGVTTLGAIFRMLRDLLQVYWFVEDGKLRLEHIFFFKNGGSYSAKEKIQLDLFKRHNSKTKLPLGVGTNKIDFEKLDMPELIKLTFADSASYIFEGLPIVFKSNFINKGRTEDINLAGFSTDVDYTLANADAISQDGFMLFAVKSEASSEEPVTDILTRFDAYLGPTASSTEDIKEDAVGWAVARLWRPALSALKIRFPGMGNGYLRYFTGAGTSLVPLNDVKVENGEASIVNLFSGYIYVCYKIRSSAINYAPEDARIITDTGYVDFYNVTNEQTKATTKISKIQLDDVIYQAQNADLAWPSIAQSYYAFNLPSTQAWMGERPLHVFGTQQKRKQTVTVSALEDPKTLGLVETGYGQGQVDRITITLTNREAKITLKHDTYR